VKISLDWLGDYVTWEGSPAELAERLTAAGLNVESIEEAGRAYPGVVVGKVVACDRHPDADRLSLCRVDMGTGEAVQVVCGAPNVRVDQHVLFAPVGAVLPGDFKLKRTKIRGVESFGMICSAAELELSNEADGILDLANATDLGVPTPDSLVLGTPADDLIGYVDVVLDIEVTPNRPDWLSHLGVAREVAAIYGAQLSPPRIWTAQQSGGGLGLRVEIEDYADCPRYTGHGARDVIVAEAPAFLKNRLRAVGARPVNNIVDITNYVLFELGQPLHAFDRAKLTGDRLMVRRAAGDRRVITLDGEEREVAPEDLVIADEQGPVALAGVMGLQNSEVGADTREILLESAFFNPLGVRRTSRALGLISESSYRFERGADWDMVLMAARRALHLFQEHAGARVVADWADRHDPDHRTPQAIPLRIFQVNRVLGTTLRTEDAADHLQSLGLKVQPMGNPAATSSAAVNMMVEVPSFRRDLHQEVDLIEEIARRHGLDKVIGTGSFRGAAGSPRRPLDQLQARLRAYLIAGGYNEVVTSSFQAEDDIAGLGIAADDSRATSLAVVNPHHGGDILLRTTLLPSLLAVVRRNVRAGCSLPARFFQINKVFWPKGQKAAAPRRADESLLPEEPLLLQVAIAGGGEPGLDGVPANLLELKGVSEALSALLRNEWQLVPRDSEVFLTGGGQWCIQNADGKAIGTAGQVSAAVAVAFGVETAVVVAEIDLRCLVAEGHSVSYARFARFPAVKRDLSLLVPTQTAYSALEKVVQEAGGDLLEMVELFDIYRGTGLPEGHGAFGIRLKFRSTKGNLKGKVVDKTIARIEQDLASKLQVRIRD